MAYCRRLPGLEPDNSLGLAVKLRRQTELSIAHHVRQGAEPGLCNKGVDRIRIRCYTLVMKDMNNTPTGNTTRIEFGYEQPADLTPAEAAAWLDAVLAGTAPATDRVIIGNITE